MGAREGYVSLHSSGGDGEGLVEMIGCVSEPSVRTLEMVCLSDLDLSISGDNHPLVRF
jgi:hypothetical protein